MRFHTHSSYFGYLRHKFPAKARHIGFVFSNSPAWKPQDLPFFLLPFYFCLSLKLALFGFVFSPPQSMQFFIFTFHIRLCANFALPQIGFVFSNSFYSSWRCPLNAEHWTLIIWVCLALNWVCFHQVSIPIYFSYPLVIIDIAFISTPVKLGLFFQI